MKRRIIWIFLAGLLVGVALSGAYKYFVTDRITDGGSGMENSDAIEVLDGDHTYVDNSLLWPALEGRWKSTDGRWQMVLGMDTGITLSLEGETVLNGELYFTYLQPGENSQTELELETKVLQKEDETALGEVWYLCHEASADGGSGTIRMELELPDGTEETITFQKTQE